MVRHTYCPYCPITDQENFLESAGHDFGLRTRLGLGQASASEPEPQVTQVAPDHERSTTARGDRKSRRDNAGGPEDYLSARGCWSPTTMTAPTSRTLTGAIGGSGSFQSHKQLSRHGPSPTARVLESFALTISPTSPTYSTCYHAHVRTVYPRHFRHYVLT